MFQTKEKHRNISYACKYSRRLQFLCALQSMLYESPVTAFAYKYVSKYQDISSDICSAV